MDILEIIRNEHREVEDIFDEAQHCDEGSKQLNMLAAEVSQKIETHVKIEERLFYAPLRDHTDQKELVDMYEAYTEHDVTGHLIALLKSGRKPDEKFKAEIQVLSESIKHHIREEESKVFSIARQVFDQEQLDELGESWAKARKRLDSPASNGASRKANARKSANARKR